ncbi:MgtC/SapB family protein [Heyndrickxia camelliae]|uniref:Methyltransferase n=1 Tax=Heyndrickxia camelliae TaxID=1707093 RepID=A0A2N3LL55_9BACI|nr:MgtC/SapB family protein [Heyndrickxia camelliae]PKR85305.1 methyltransferase [Heyndrickxia camelliae]
MTELELMARLVIAGILGALVGFEREKRFKEAGLRTHFLVAVGSALAMIVSKYAFYDVVHTGTIELDPSRIAAGVVSGVGFLGAGTILVQRQSVRGLTTAAGLWATAGIGLAIGAGMYIVSICGTILVLVGLEVLKRLFQPIISKVHKLNIHVTSNEVIVNILDILTSQQIDVVSYQVTVISSDTHTHYSIDFQLKSKKTIKDNEIVKLLQVLPEIERIKFD